MVGEVEKKTITIDPKKLPEGTCQVATFPSGERYAVYKEENKIKILPIIEEKE